MTSFRPRVVVLRADSLGWIFAVGVPLVERRQGLPSLLGSRPVDSERIARKSASQQQEAADVRD